MNIDEMIKHANGELKEALENLKKIYEQTSWKTVWSPCSKCGHLIEKVLQDGKEIEIIGSCIVCKAKEEHKQKVKENVDAMKEAFKDPEIIKLIRSIINGDK